jgi:hypothetical protein
MVNADEGVHWTDDGKAFRIPNPTTFADQQLPLWFRDIQFSSFVRQLNMYDFHKIPSSLEGDISVTFQHELFQKGEPDMLGQIERKRPPTRITPPGSRGASDTRRRQAPYRRSPANALPGKSVPDLHAPGPSSPTAAATSSTGQTQLVEGNEPTLALDSILVPHSFPPSISNAHYDHTQAASALLSLPMPASLQLSDPAHFPQETHIPLLHTSEQQQTLALPPVSVLLASVDLDQGQEGDDVGNSETIDFFFPS